MIIDGEDENSSVFVCIDCDRKKVFVIYYGWNMES